MNTPRFMPSRRPSPVRAAVTATLLLLAAAAAPGTSHASTQLWLYPEGDDPRAGGHVVSTGTFTLVLENLGGGGGDPTAHDVFLVLSVEDPATLGSATLLLPDGSAVVIEPPTLQLGSPILPCSGHEFPPHGVYPAHFTTVAVGDLAGGESLTIGVDILGGDDLRAHFDALGIGYRQTGLTLSCFDISNPSGHDVGVVLGDPGPPPCERLAVDKTASAAGVDLGDPVDYLIAVENAGSCDLTQVIVVEDIPTVPSGEAEVPAFSIVAMEPPSAAQSPDEVTWALGTLPAGTGMTITLSVVFDEELADGRVVVNTACAGAAELEDPVCARARVAVGDVGSGIGGPGFWCNQFRFTIQARHHARFSTAELEDWLTAITDASPVFSELYDVGALEPARALLCRPDLADTAADRLARHVLTLRLNLVGARLGPATSLGSLCVGAEPPPPGMDPEMTVAEVLAGAEADLVAGAGDATLGSWAELVDFINGSSAPGDLGCQGHRRGRGRF